MAILYVTEYDRVPRDGPLGVAMGGEPAKAAQTVPIGVASTQSAAFGSTTLYVRVHADAICSIAFGANPTAAGTSARMAANQTEYFMVQPGGKIAVISNV